MYLFGRPNMRNISESYRTVYDIMRLLSRRGEPGASKFKEWNSFIIQKKKKENGTHEFVLLQSFYNTDMFINIDIYTNLLNK